MQMIRKQIYLNTWQDQRLAELSEEAGTSEADIIRQALDAYFLALDELPRNHPLSALAGIGSSKSGSAGAANHDKTIYGV